MANNNNLNDPENENDMAWLFAGIVVFALIVGAFFLVPAYNNGNNLSNIEPAAGTSNTVAPSDTTGGYTAPDNTLNNNTAPDQNALPPQPTPAPSNP